MAEKYAVRNLRLCTKDCICLYVCLSQLIQKIASLMSVMYRCGVCAGVSFGSDIYGTQGYAGSANKTGHCCRSNAWFNPKQG